MEADVRAAAVEHSGGCGACGQRLRDEDMLSRGLRTLAADMSSAVAPAAIESNLRAAFRAREVTAPTVSNSLRYASLAAAAVVLMVFSVAALRLRNENAVPEIPANPTTSSLASVVPITKEAAAISEASIGAPPHKQRVLRNRTAPRIQRSPSPSEDAVAVNNHPIEVTTDFMPLSYLNTANLQDGGQIVRVELPRSALANFGLPVNMERYNERVKADVLLGVDGLAHAIRFVQ